jgi:hypothetical protein
MLEVFGTRLIIFFNTGIANAHTGRVHVSLGANPPFTQIGRGNWGVFAALAAAK